MIKYEYKKKENKFTENGHIMVEFDVLQRLKRLAYLEERLMRAQLLPIDSVIARFCAADKERTELANQALNLPVVMPSVYGIFKHESDKVYGFYWSLELAEEICNERDGEDWYVDELCIDQHYV